MAAWASCRSEGPSATCWATGTSCSSSWTDRDGRSRSEAALRGAGGADGSTFGRPPEATHGGGRDRRAVVAAILSTMPRRSSHSVVYVIVTSSAWSHSPTSWPALRGGRGVAGAATGNPVNVIVSDRLGESAVGLVPILLPCRVASVVALLAACWSFYRRQLPAHSLSCPPRAPGRRLASSRALAGRVLGGCRRLRSGFGGRSALGPTLAAVWVVLLGSSEGWSSVWPLDGIGWSLLVFVASMGSSSTAFRRPDHGPARGIVLGPYGIARRGDDGFGGPPRSARTCSTTCPPRS